MGDLDLDDSAEELIACRHVDDLHMGAASGKLAGPTAPPLEQHLDPSPYAPLVEGALLPGEQGLKVPEPLDLHLLGQLILASGLRACRGARCI